MGCAWVVGAAARRAGRTEVARATLEEVDEGTRDPSSVLISPLAAIELALLDVDEDDVDAAWERAHDALGVAAGSHQHVTVLDALDLIAELHAGASGETSAARILGGTERWRSDFGFLPFALEPGRRAQTIARVRDALGSEFDTEWDAGAALDIDALVALVRRGRGRRGRPASGWASLTPAEREVVQLVAKGLSNPAIADRLFVSTNTVKTHLAHVYAKLGTSSRAEVAAEAVRHGA